MQSTVLPYTDELWMEVEYLGSSSSPLGSIVSTTKTNLLAGASPVAIDSSVWAGAPLLLDSRTTTMTLNGTPSNVTMTNGNLTATRGSTAIGGVNSTSFDGPAVGNLGVKYYFEGPHCPDLSDNRLRSSRLDDARRRCITTAERFYCRW